MHIMETFFVFSPKVLDRNTVRAPLCNGILHLTITTLTFGPNVLIFSVPFLGQFVSIFVPKLSIYIYNRNPINCYRAHSACFNFFP